MDMLSHKGDGLFDILFNTLINIKTNEVLYRAAKFISKEYFVRAAVYSVIMGMV